MTDDSGIFSVNMDEPLEPQLNPLVDMLNAHFERGRKCLEAVEADPNRIHKGDLVTSRGTIYYVTQNTGNVLWVAGVDWRNGPYCIVPNDGYTPEQVVTLRERNAVAFQDIFIVEVDQLNMVHWTSEGYDAWAAKEVFDPWRFPKNEIKPGEIWNGRIYIESGNLLNATYKEKED